MVDCSKYVCDVHFLLIWLLLRKDYTTNNLIKVWHWIDQIIFVHSHSKLLSIDLDGKGQNLSKVRIKNLKFLENQIHENRN